MSEHMDATSRARAEIHAVVVRDGRRIDLGVVTSPYDDRLRNEIWKWRKAREIRRLLNGQDQDR